MSIKLIPSEEQTKILELINNNNNIIIDSIAGSGKTSTVLFIAEKNPTLKILVLTYNSQLKNETRKRAVNYDNLDVHSYHSFCTTNYDSSAYTDSVMNDIIDHDIISMNTIDYDIIIADESQDIIPLFYRLLAKIFNDNKKKYSCKIVIMGDKMQSIYRFKESDSRFITFADKIFCKFNNYVWKNTTLMYSFRCTIPMVNFVNECMIGYTRMYSTKESKYKPDYVICNSYGTRPRKILEDYLKIYKPHDIFVLAYSIKDKTPIKNLANYVTNNLGISIFCSSSDQESLDSRVIEGKLVFTTIHQSKGRERKVVIFLGFDEGYFEYYDKESDVNMCPNELYVASTRASERLTLIHDQKKGYLPFLNLKKLKINTNFIDDSKGAKIAVKCGFTPEDNFTVSELLSYLPFSIENECIKLLDVKVIKTSGYKLDIPGVVKMANNSYESVSDITGIAIPAYFEYTINGSATIYSKNLIEDNIKIIECGSWSDETKLVAITKLKKFSKVLKQFHKDNIENINMKNLSASDILKISLYYSSQQNKTDYKLKQITTFDWLSKELLDEGTRRMNIIRSKSLSFEESIETYLNKLMIIGEIDCIDNENKIVYEFKCTKDLTINHMIQLGIYMYIHAKPEYKYRLFNIYTDEIREITSTREKLEQMVKMLIDHKLSNSIVKTDIEFLEQFE